MGNPFNKGDMVRLRRQSRNADLIRSHGRGPFKVEGCFGEHFVNITWEGDGEPRNCLHDRFELFQANAQDLELPAYYEAITAG